jgi:hypothetical protein
MYIGDQRRLLYRAFESSTTHASSWSKAEEEISAARLKSSYESLVWRTFHGLLFVHLLALRRATALYCCIGDPRRLIDSKDEYGDTTSFLYSPERKIAWHTLHGL